MQISLARTLRMPVEVIQLSRGRSLKTPNGISAFIIRREEDLRHFLIIIAEVFTIQMTILMTGSWPTYFG